MKPMLPKKKSGICTRARQAERNVRQHLRMARAAFRIYALHPNPRRDGDLLRRLAMARKDCRQAIKHIRTMTDRAVAFRHDESYCTEATALIGQVGRAAERIAEEALVGAFSSARLDQWDLREEYARHRARFDQQTKNHFKAWKEPARSAP